MKSMHILIFDTNTVFSRRVGETIEAFAPGIRISYAQNSAVLQARLQQDRFDLILADPSTSFDVEETELLLREVQQTHSTPVIIWTFLTKSPVVEGCNFSKVIRKPAAPGEIDLLNLTALMSV